MPRTPQRPERISLRLSRAAKRKLEHAAAYSEKTLADFVIDVALQKAEAITGMHEETMLTSEEWERFCALLLHPPTPNRRLRRALAEHSRVVTQ